MKKLRQLADRGTMNLAEIDDGMTTGWICVHVTGIEPAESERSEPAPTAQAGFVGFDDSADTITLTVHMFTEQKRAEWNLKSFGIQILIDLRGERQRIRQGLGQWHCMMRYTQRPLSRGPMLRVSNEILYCVLRLGLLLNYSSRSVCVSDNACSTSCLLNVLVLSLTSLFPCNTYAGVALTVLSGSLSAALVIREPDTIYPLYQKETSRTDLPESVESSRPDISGIDYAPSCMTCISCIQIRSTLPIHPESRGNREAHLGAKKIEKFSWSRNESYTPKQRYSAPESVFGRPRKNNNDRL